MSKKIMKQYLVIEIPKNTLFLSTTLGPFGSFDSVLHGNIFQYGGQHECRKAMNQRRWGRVGID